MAVKEIRLDDLADELGAHTQAEIERLRLATISGVARSIPDLVAASPVDTGLYAQSWDFTPTESGAIVGNYAPHAAVIEYGARPFTPPIGPLLAWAKRVLQDGSQPPSYSPEVWALARGVQRKIAAQGMQPKRILEQAIPDIILNIRREYESGRT